jgi:hypothetical protein
MARLLGEGVIECVAGAKDVTSGEDKTPMNSQTNSTRVWVPPGHFYSPIVNQDEAREHLSRLGGAHSVSSLPGIAIDRDEMKNEFYDLLPFLNDCPFQANQSDGLRYFFENPAYCWADGGILHAMLRRFRPKRLIEVGSGWSSACAIDTIEKYVPDTREVTFVEPHPGLLKKLIGSTPVPITIIDKPVQKVPVSLFSRLESGDFLFIDSTHVAKTGSDVCYEIFEILPSLKKGVFVHFHDVFWPFEYPHEWAVNENRSWNEVYFLRAFLQNNSDWRVVFFNHYFSVFAGDVIAAEWPPYLNNTGGSLWLQRC